VNTLFADNYKYILIAAKRITPQHYKELINETYIAIHHITPPDNNQGFVKWYCKCMGNINKWQNSSFNQAIKINAINFTIDVAEQNEPEQINPHLIKETLAMHERELFSLHYEHNLSAKKIALLLEKENQTKESYQSYQRLINIMKTKIHKWKQLNL
jgi:hypothetical protein